MSETPVPVSAPEAPLTPVQALVGTFTAPSETFRRLRARPTWWLPLALWIVLGLCSSFASMPKVDWETSARQALEKRAEKSGQSTPPEAVPRVASFMKLSGAIGVPVYLLFASFFVPLVLWGAAKAFGGEMGYSQATSLWLHANLPNAAKALVAIPLALSVPDASISLQNMGQIVKSNVGAFLPEGTPAFVIAFASSFDIFSLYALVLLVIGFRRIPSLSKGAATAIPVVLWLILVLSGTGFAAMRG